MPMRNMAVQSLTMMVAHVTNRTLKIPSGMHGTNKSVPRLPTAALAFQQVAMVSTKDLSMCI